MIETGANPQGGLCTTHVPCAVVLQGRPGPCPAGERLRTAAEGGRPQDRGASGCTSSCPVATCGSRKSGLFTE